ncbi:MAG: hypothetical protein ACTSPI_04685 [Candidatus Heimdallarchaeaceae archaeon]
MAQTWLNNKVDNNTGEIVFISTKPAISRFNDKGYLFLINHNYSRVFANIDIPSMFSDSQIGKIYKLKNYIQKDSNLLQIRTSKGYRSMLRIDIGKIFKLQDRQTKTFTSKLIKHGIIAEVTILCENRKVKQLYMNPLYFCNAKRINATLYNIFKLQLDPYLNKWVKEEFAERLKE